MEQTEMLKKHAILNRLCTLPQKVLSLHGVENITDFVLHDICNASCFNLPKAAYLVDNPDFDCLKGIAGFCNSQAFTQDTIWETPEVFIEYVKNAPFNQKVRSIIKPSSLKSQKSDQETTQIISDYLGIINPSYCSWQMKHDNHGILIYESASDNPTTIEMIKKGACLLGFCPIY